MTGMSEANEQGGLALGTLEQLVEDILPEGELKPRSIDEVFRLPAFSEKIASCEKILGTRYSEIDHSIQDALTLRRLQQMVNTLLLNPVWKERIEKSGLKGAPRNFEEWQQIPISDKGTMSELLMGTRPGLVVPLSYGGFEIVASGGTSGGLPVEIVYSLRELHDTYKLAGDFMGRYVLDELAGHEPKWMVTTLADYQMWSSGTMVGGVLQHIPGINYIGAGPIRKEVFQHILSYQGPKAFMGISQGIGILTDLGEGLAEGPRRSFRVALYGSGVLPQLKRMELKALYPHLVIKSYFAATQAETIGLQLTAESPLVSVPGLHLIEIVDSQGRWVAEGEQGELVVTRLHAHEAPFPRFKVGDRMVRRPNLDGPGLKAQQFEFSGRSGDVLHIGDTQYSAPQAYGALCRELRATGVFDLETLAHEFQFVNSRETKMLSLLVATDNVQYWNARLYGLGAHGVRRVFSEALIRSLSLFNQGEANVHSIEKTGYRFEIRLLPRGSSEIFRTEVGKVPVIRDVVSRQKAR